MMNSTHHLLVVDENGRLTGIVSDRDIKKFVSPFAGSGIATPRDDATLKLRVNKIMTKNVVVIPPETTIRACIESMLKYAIHSLPVQDNDGKLIGIVTSTNILNYVLNII